MAILTGGRPIYGNALGVLVLDTTYPAIPGNVANACSYDFPVRFRIMDLPSNWWCDARGPDDERFRIFLEAAKSLQAEGVKAITSGCGFFAIYQRRAADQLDVPIFTSPLLMIPMISQLIGKKNKVGIITAGKPQLATGGFLKAAGIDESIPLAIEGMESSAEFYDVIVNQTKATIDTHRFERDVVAAADALINRHPDVGAIVLECSDLPPCARAVAAATKRPVFDYLTLANLVYRSFFPPGYEGFM